MTCYQSAIASKLLDSGELPPSSQSSSVEDHWEHLRDALVGAGQDHLGRPRRSQPDWFLDSQDVIAPLLQERRECYNKWVKTGCPTAHACFKAARSTARSEIRRAKNQWMARVAAQAELGRKTFHGKSVWTSIRTLQRNHQGLVPLRTPIVRDEQGVICSSAVEQRQRWCRHFENVLNVESDFRASVFATLPTYPVLDGLDEEPTLTELQLAVKCMRNNKAAGESGILAEMVKYAGVQVHASLLALVHKVWQTGSVPQAWKDAELVPIPKKGDLSQCDNWRGIALLEVVGKIVGRLIQNRLQEFAEEVLPESQCGFRHGRSCTDQIFSLLQIMEKLHEHRSRTFIIFIDLRNA